MLDYQTHDLARQPPKGVCKWRAFRSLTRSLGRPRPSQSGAAVEFPRSFDQGGYFIKDKVTWSGRLPFMTRVRVIARGICLVLKGAIKSGGLSLNRC